MKLWSAVMVAALSAALPALKVHADLKSLHQAAQRGRPNAELKLGELYQYGVGLPDHLVHALAWYDRAASRSPRAAVLAKRVAARLNDKQRQQAAAFARPRLGPPSLLLRPSAKGTVTR